VALVGLNGSKPDREKLRRLYEEHGRGFAKVPVEMLVIDQVDEKPSED
jgi:hypothetical protein